MFIFLFIWKISCSNQNLFIIPASKINAMEGESYNLDKVEFSGFRKIDSSAMDVLKRNVSKHMHRLNELAENIQNLHITLKTVHEREKSEKYEIIAKLNNNGKIFASEVTDRNLLAAVDSALNNVISEMD